MTALLLVLAYVLAVAAALRVFRSIVRGNQRRWP